MQFRRLAATAFASPMLAAALVAPAAIVKGVSGLVIGPGDFYWNIRKN